MIQALKNTVINGAVILALLFGLMVSATAVSVSDFERDKALAEQGGSYYQFHLGSRYENGNGIQQDYTKAFYWYQKSANQGNKFGQFSMGYAYANGQGVRQDHRKALEWFKESAAQNNPFSQAYIGSMYENGDGVRQNKTTAKEWYGQSCDNGMQYGCDNYKKLNEQGY